eukprot:1156499-Pelagomonas_calceolata.AAC.9
MEALAHASSDLGLPIDGGGVTLNRLCDSEVDELELALHQEEVGGLQPESAAQAQTADDGIEVQSKKEEVGGLQPESAAQAQTADGGLEEAVGRRQWERAHKRGGGKEAVGMSAKEAVGEVRTGHERKAREERKEREPMQAARAPLASSKEKGMSLWGKATDL